MSPWRRLHDDATFDYIQRIEDPEGYAHRMKQLWRSLTREGQVRDSARDWPGSKNDHFEMPALCGATNLGLAAFTAKLSDVRPDGLGANATAGGPEEPAC